MAIFKIKQDDGTFVDREPTANKWYAGFDHGDDGDQSGAIGQYIGHGRFVDEDLESDDVNMSGYDYLVEQL